MNILEKIVEHKRVEVATRKKKLSVEELKDGKYFPRPCYPLADALNSSSAGIIAEFKRKSPSKGFIKRGADAVEITSGYRKAGASAVSVLTDGEFFGGSPDDLFVVRPYLDIPVLRKDFMIDTYQLYEAKAMGADAVLLIAAVLGLEACGELAAEAKKLGLSTLLEIHGEDELDWVGKDIDVVGVNNRNLGTFVTDTGVSLRLGSMIPDGFVKISESGISDAATVIGLRDAGFRGFLIGETFMKEPEPAHSLAAFIERLGQ